jgi:hypothetical protein
VNVKREKRYSPEFGSVRLTKLVNGYILRPDYENQYTEPNNPYYVGAGHRLTKDNRICMNIELDSGILCCRVCNKSVCADCGIRKKNDIYCSTSHSDQHFKLCSGCKCEIAVEEFDIEKGMMFNGMMKEEGERESGKRYQCDGCREYLCCNCIYEFKIDDFDYCEQCNLYHWNKELGVY